MNSVFSDWQKIDLHIHTDWSRKTKEGDYNGNFSVDKLKEKMVENGVSIFSLTDHNIINIDAYKEYYSNYDESKDPLLLLGVELDIEVNTTSYGVKTYHSLIIFNYFDADNAQTIYDKLESKYLEKGVNDKARTLEIDDLISLFPEDDFFFIPHAGNTKSIISGYRENIEDAQKMVLLMPSAFEKVKEKARQEYNKGFDRVLTYDFQERNDIPYINCSDNHNIEEYPCTNKGGKNSNTHQFYFVKGGKNFETLRLAFIDPESRIKSTEQLNEIRSSFNYIEKVNISDDQVLTDCELEFSPHLNVLIGGRSSGKSLMMSVLGDKIDSVTINRGKYGVGYDKVEIKSKLDMYYKSNTSLTKDEVIYINQGDIVRYFEEQKLHDLAKESDKIVAYEAAKRGFLEHKKRLEECRDNFFGAYSTCSDYANQTHELHNTTIEDVLNDEFVFISNNKDLKNKIDITDLLEEAKKLLSETSEKTVLLEQNDLLDIEKGDVELIQKFKQFLDSKSKLIKKKIKANERKLLF
jgi:hypothetical protein